MKLQKVMQRAALWALLAIVALMLAPTALAFEGQSGDTVVIDAGEVIEDDLYVGATNFTLNGVVAGDLIVGATNVVINGVVEGDLFAAAQSVIINGAVGDDARIGAYLIELGPEAEIGDDLVAAGYSLQMRRGSEVGGDFIFGGYQALLEGEIGEDGLVGVNALQINGRIAGDLQAEVSGADDDPQPMQFMPNLPPVPTIPNGLTLGESAVIGGALSYRAQAPVATAAGVAGGPVTFEEAVITGDETAQNPVLQTVWRQLRGLIALLLIGGLLVWRAPGWIDRLSAHLTDNPLPTFGWGAAVYFGVPFLVFVLFSAAILLAILFGVIGLGNVGATLFWVIIGLLFAGMITFVMTLLYLTKIVVGYLLGKQILQRVNPALVERPFLPLALGILLIMIVIAIPWLGALINWLIAIAGLGALFMLLRHREKAPAL